MAAPNALVAAAQVLTGDRHQDPAQQVRPWQEEVWEFYDTTGPLRYASNWLANLCSRARLQAATLSSQGDEPEPVDGGPAADMVEELAGGARGQSQLLKSAAIDLTVPGLCYLVGEGVKNPIWRIFSADVLRMKTPAGKGRDAVYELRTETGNWRPLAPESLIVKIWRPHERLYWEPDSPARAALTSLRELRRIAQYIDANLVSRLAGAGIFIIPQEVSYPTAPNEPDGPHPFITEVIDVMMEAVRKPGTAAAVTPIPLEVPAQFADAFKHLTFHTELSDKILEMRESALRQCSITLDVPAEVLTGMGDVNHWGQWQIEESAVKVHAEPLLSLICSALTNGYLLPMLRAQGIEGDELASYVVVADTSELSTKPDKSDDTFAAYDRGEAGGEALRREAGLSEADKPDEEELAVWAFKQLLKQPANAPLALEAMGIKLPEPAPAAVAPPNGNGANGNGQVPPELAPTGQDGVPATEGDQPAEMDVAVLVLESHVHRALERASNRIRSKRRTELQDCQEEPYVCLEGVCFSDDLLAGAWDRLTPVLTELQLDVASTISQLNLYCRTLIEHGIPYDRTSFTRMLKVAA